MTYLYVEPSYQVRGPMGGAGTYSGIFGYSGPRIYYGVHLDFRAAGSLTMAPETPFFNGVGGRKNDVLICRAP